MEEGNAEAFAEMFRTARDRAQKLQYEVVNEAGCSSGFLSMIESRGIFPGMRAAELLRLVAYYHLDIHKVAALLGVALEDDGKGLTAFEQQLATVSTLPNEEQEWLVEVLDTLLRGMR